MYHLFHLEKCLYVIVVTPVGIGFLVFWFFSYYCSETSKQLAVAPGSVYKQRFSQLYRCVGSKITFLVYLTMGDKLKKNYLQKYISVSHKTAASLM